MGERYHYILLLQGPNVCTWVRKGKHASILCVNCDRILVNEFCGEISNLITDARNARIFEQYEEEKYIQGGEVEEEKVERAENETIPPSV